MDKLSLETTCIGIVGLLGLNLALKAVSHLYKTFLRPGKDLKKLGKWAVVTGATGMFFVVVFATAGFLSSILVSQLSHSDRRDRKGLCICLCKEGHERCLDQ